MGEWTPATDPEECIAFVRSLRNFHHDFAFVPPKATERCVRSGQGWVARDSEGKIAGLALSNGKTLWNLFIREDARGAGLGSAFLAQFRPKFIRAKVSSDKRLPTPVPFYEKNGYWVLGPVPSTMGKHPIQLMSNVQRPLPIEAERDQSTGDNEGG